MDSLGNRIWLELLYRGFSRWTLRASSLLGGLCQRYVVFPIGTTSSLCVSDCVRRINQAPLCCNYNCISLMKLLKLIVIWAYLKIEYTFIQEQQSFNSFFSGSIDDSIVIIRMKVALTNHVNLLEELMKALLISMLRILEWGVRLNPTRANNSQWIRIITLLDFSGIFVDDTRRLWV